MRPTKNMYTLMPMSRKTATAALRPNTYSDRFALVRTSQRQAPAPHLVPVELKILYCFAHILRCESHIDEHRLGAHARPAGVVHTACERARGVSEGSGDEKLQTQVDLGKHAIGCVHPPVSRCRRSIEFHPFVRSNDNVSEFPSPNKDDG